MINIVGKIIKIVLATRISYIAIIYKILFKTNFENQCKLYIEIVIYYLPEKTYIA